MSYTGSCSTPRGRRPASATGAPHVSVGVNEGGFVVITAELLGDGPVDASIAVGPEGTFACSISTGDTHLASTATDAQSFEQVLTDRLTQLGVRRQEDEV